MDAFLFRELEIHITKFWSFVGDTSTVGVSDEICVVGFEVFFINFSDIEIKRRSIGESDEFITRNGTENMIVSFSFKNCFDAR